MSECLIVGGLGCEKLGQPIVLVIVEVGCPSVVYFDFYLIMFMFCSGFLLWGEVYLIK